MNFYEILKTKKLGRGSPDYWTQLFSEHVGGTGERTVTGVLPLTFTAKAGNVSDWVIYGNDENGTENLWNNELIQGTVNSATGELVIGTMARIRSSTYSSAMLDAGTYTINANGVDKVMIFVYDSGYNYHCAASTATWATLPYTFTINESFYYVTAFKFDDDSTITPDDISQIMLVSGSTAPDHYIPYQQGVGERTAQLFTDTVGKRVITVAAGTTLSTGITNPMTLAAGRYTIHYYQSTSMTSNTRNTLSFLTVATGVQTYEKGSPNHKLDAGWYSWTFDIPNDGSYQMRIWIVDASDEVKATSFILTKGETATPTEYIPYGYQIPLTVSQQGQTDKNYDIYIGDSPLTEGETVSKTSTGQDIELFGGENTVSTTLYNKPTMEIKYK